jgi:uncharacterized membrane protein
MNEDAKEFLGIGKHDVWYYPGLVMALASFWISNALAVAVLLVASTGLLFVFLVKATPRYVNSHELKTGTRIFGIVGNVVLVALQIGIVAFRIYRLLA